MSIHLMEKPPVPTLTRCVLYARVSSKKQVEEGSGLQSQITRCRDYANIKKLSVENIFMDEGISGAVLDRPGMQQLLEFIRENGTPQSPYVVIIDDLSRLARSVRTHEELREAITAAGGLLCSPSMRFSDDADGRMVELMQATVAQHFREKNAETTRNRLSARWASGYYTANPPLGMTYRKVEGHGKMLVPDEPIASYVREAFNGLANGRFQSATEVKRFFESKPDFPRNSKGEVRLQTVIDMVHRCTYAGFLTVKSRGIHMRPAKHKPLIDVDTWEAAKARLDGKAHAPARTNIAADFALRSHLVCASCGGQMTSGWSQGRNRKYAYYVCQHRGCELRNKGVRRETVEGAFLDLIKSLTPAPELLGIMRDLCRKFWDHMHEDGQSKRDRIAIETAAIERKIDSLTTRLLETEVPSVITAYERQIGKLELKKAALKQQSGQTLEPQKKFDEVFSLVWAFLAKPWILWEKGDHHHKRLLLRLTLTDTFAYCRDKGLEDCLNRKIAMPFGTYGDFEKNSGMVPRGGIDFPI